VVQRNDSGETAAPVRSVARITLATALLGVDSLAVHARIDSMFIERDSLIPAPDSAAAPVVASFDAIITPHGEYLAYPAAAANGCDGEEPLLAAAREMVMDLPDVLAAGTQWSDSTSITICRGGMPVTTGMVRHYQVVGPMWSDDTVAVIRLTRESTFTLAGTGRTARNQIVALTGRGQSRDTLDLDPTLGLVRAATRDGLTELSFTYGGKATDCEQRMRQDFQILPPAAERH
jgi:hypothetical protein